MAEQALRRRKKSPLSSDSAWAYVFVAPQMLGVAVFVLIPVCFAFYLSLCNWNLVSAPQFIGLDNFRKVLNKLREVEKLLLKVQKPGRYVGGELNEVIKDKNDVDVRFAFCRSGDRWIDHACVPFQALRIGW